MEHLTNPFILPSKISIKEYQPSKSQFIAQGAKVLGEAILAEDVSIWYNSVIRADINKIVIGKGSNIQDNSVLHVDNAFPCIVGNYCVIGHNVTLHGCEIEDFCLIGMGAVLLNGVKVGRGSIIAAGSVVKENTQIEPYSLFAGIPSKKIKNIAKEVEKSNKKMAMKYIDLKNFYLKSIY